jgi:hypothetical protein
MLVTNISVRVDMTEMGVGVGVLMSDRSSLDFPIGKVFVLVVRIVAVSVSMPKFGMSMGKSIG